MVSIVEVALVFWRDIRPHFGLPVGYKARRWVGDVWADVEWLDTYSRFNVDLFFRVGINTQLALALSWRMTQKKRSKIIVWTPATIQIRKQVPTFAHEYARKL